MTKNFIIKTLDRLISTGIKLICIDFDNTFISINTYGRWDGDAIELTNYIRPIFVKFIRKTHESYLMLLILISLI